MQCIVGRATIGKFKSCPIAQAANTSACLLVDLHNKRGYHHSIGFGHLLNPRYNVQGAAAAIAARISRAVEPLLQKDPEADICVVVDLGNPNFATNLQR
jgi:hypothetical protein